MSKTIPSAPHVHLLTVVVVVSCLLSAYTTADGVYRILREWNPMAAVTAAIGFAVVLGGSMIYLTFEVRNRRSMRDVTHLVAIYLLVAAISIFFNFNSIFSAFTSRDLASLDAQKIRAKILENIAVGEERLKLTYSIDRLTATVEQAKRAADFEATREDRPGKRSRYIALKQKWSQTQADLDAASGLYNRDRQPLLVFREQLGAAGTKATFEEADAEVHRLASLHLEVAAWLRSHSIQESPASADLEQLTQNRRSVAASMAELVRNVETALSGTASSATLFHFWIAVVLSCTLDLLVFGLVLALPKASEKSVQPRGLPEPIRWDPL